MPEPGIGDSNFDRPTTDHKKPRRRPPARMKLPGEYAEFRLKDGRYLGEVMGESFFGPETGSQGGRPISDSERQRIRDGNYPLAGMFRDDPRFRPRPETEAGRTDRSRVKVSAISADASADIAMPSAPAMPGGDFEDEFTNPPNGREEGDAANIVTGSPIDRQQLAGIGGGMPGPDKGADAPGKQEFTSADILDPRDRQGSARQGRDL